MTRREDWVGQMTARGPGHARNDRRRTRRLNNHGWVGPQAMARGLAKDGTTPACHECSKYQVPVLWSQALQAAVAKKIEEFFFFCRNECSLSYGSRLHSIVLILIVILLHYIHRTRSRNELPTCHRPKTRLPKSANQSPIPPYLAPAASRVRFEVLGCTPVGLT